MAKKADIDLNEGAETPDEEPVSQVTRFAPAPVQAPVDIAAIVKAAVEAALSAGEANTDKLSAAITHGMQQVAAPIHENKTSDGVSERNPLGELQHPAPALKCDMWFGVIQDGDERKVVKVAEYEPRDLTIWEVLALNLLEPVEATIKRLDRVDLRVIVEGKRNQVSGKLERLTLAFPMTVIGSKSHENKNMIPDLTSVVYQLTKHDVRPESLPFPEKREELAWLMAEHRAGRYVGPRQTVAA